MRMYLPWFSVLQSARAPPIHPSRLSRRGCPGVVNVTLSISKGWCGRRSFATNAGQAGGSARATANDTAFKRLTELFKTIASNWFYLVITADVAYGQYVEVRRNRAVTNSIERGVCPPPETADLFVERADMVAKVKQLLQPTNRTRSFAHITGEEGCGKTTIVRQAAIEVGSGVVYVAVPNNINNFGKAFARQIGFEYEEFIGVTSTLGHKLLGLDPKADIQIDPAWLASLERAKNVFYDHARDFKVRHGRPAVLIIDNAERLAKKSPNGFQIILDFAKDCAEESTVIVVLVTRQTLDSPNAMEGASTWSNHVLPPLEVGDVDEATAVRFLQFNGIDGSTATHTVREVTGGRFRLLLAAALRYSRGDTFDDVKDDAMTRAEAALERLGLLDKNTDEHKYGFPLLLSLAKLATAKTMRVTSGAHAESIKDRRIPYASVVDVVPSRELRDRLLNGQVFTSHTVDHTVSFASRMIETFAVAMLQEERKVTYAAGIAPHPSVATVDKKDAIEE